MVGTDPAANSYAEGIARRTAGDERGAVAAFLMAFALAPENPSCRRAAFDILNVMSGYERLPPAVTAALERTTQDDNLDLQPLAQVIRNLFAADTRLAALTTALAESGDTAETAVDNAGWLLEHKILIAVLSRAINISVPIENVLSALRRDACLRLSRGENSRLLTKFPAAALALVQQCVANRHAWPQTPRETAALAALAVRSDADAILIRAAYHPPDSFDASQVAALPPSLALLRRQREDERQRAAALPELTPLAPGLSAAMRAQYEAYPYPRWRQIAAPTRRSLHALLTDAVPGETFDTALNGEVDILVAGCGTGHPALSLALGLTGARILAIDLSRVSLAYAARRAEELNADNIAFAVADILTLGRIDRRFDLVDCSGVLHHMTDPAAGLAVLSGLLQPRGVIKIGLYSERGRTAEIAAQQFVRDRQFPDTTEGLRQARAVLLALPSDHPARAVIETPDFFTLDGLHDLIFNIHESRFTPASVKRLLTRCGLQAIAVEAPPLLGGNAFRTEHPDPNDWADLDLWDAFEARHPDVFAQMIQVWCRPRGESA